MTTYLEDLFSLKGQTALVAGGAGAIGREISIALAQAGATVIVHDLSQDRLDEVSELFANRGFDFMGMQMDLSTEEAATELVNDAVLQTGRIDILVNLQGANRRKPINEVTQEDFDLITSVNMRSVFFMSKAVHRVMKAQGGGRIVHFSSLSANVSFDTISVYAATKAAVTSLTRSQAHEWAVDGIQVNSIEPGFVKTEFTRQLWDDDYRAEWFANYIPQGRMATPEDLVTTTLYLVAPATRYLTGQNIIIDGGVMTGASWVEAPRRPAIKR
ncbi:short-chain dehydrogenase/reductase [Octadecabacter arcticus 238]|jgi:NAD(P)-dependent dehydrogenase (short-subunit alcohol dehydrogenase family)|uniref:Short-chain dehydrogenase/reductase n=1 Tax=Octadecabacter arcticus 238 TaxID=391616 RepID=M9RIU5_9RHOB|nr:SDR family oxidoreductase [Octadecabacter arcticus]AGI72484.1 short-chain dehydrogenase/reductase [Octadecabacter arcticus 238]